MTIMLISGAALSTEGRASKLGEVICLALFANPFLLIFISSIIDAKYDLSDKIPSYLIFRDV